MKRKLNHLLDLMGDRTARRAGRPATVLAACLDSASSGRTPGVVSGMTRTTEPGAHRVGVAAEGVRTGDPNLRWVGGWVGGWGLGMLGMGAKPEHERRL